MPYRDDEYEDEDRLFNVEGIWPADASDLRISDIEIYARGIDRPYREIGHIRAEVGAATAFSKTPTIEDVNLKLQEQALKMGANAIINVQYHRGVSLLSWKVLTATGMAVYVESDEMKCPFCAELIKKEAIKCKHCGEYLQKSSGD